MDSRIQRSPTTAGSYVTSKPIFSSPFVGAGISTLGKDQLCGRKNKPFGIQDSSSSEKTIQAIKSGLYFPRSGSGGLNKKDPLATIRIVIPVFAEVRI